VIHCWGGNGRTRQKNKTYRIDCYNSELLGVRSGGCIAFFDDHFGIELQDGTVFVAYLRY